MPPKAPFQLLELNVMSGQDLAPVVTRMKTYAVAWVFPDNRLTTKVDSDGCNNPTWNDKFIFGVNEDFLHDDTSAVIVEIYARHWFRDILVGTVRVLVSNLILPPAKPRQKKNQQVGMRFVALQVRRPSGRPQGILNIGIAVIDSSSRSMPLCTELSSSPVGHCDLIGKDDSRRCNHDQQNESKPTLRRSKSDRSDLERTPQLEKEESSSINGSGIGVRSTRSRKLKHRASKKKGSRSKSKAGSMVSGSTVGRKKHGKASSSMLSESEILVRGKHDRKQSSTMTGSEVVDPTPKAGNISNGRKSFMNESDMDTPRTIDTPKESVSNKMLRTKIPGLEFGALRKVQLTSTKSFSKFHGYDLRGSTLKGGNGSILSISDVGPSPSEVAAALAAQGRYYYTDETSSKGWSLDESEEGLKLSKLERWHTKLPPVYDRDEVSNLPPSSEGRHARGHTNSWSGLFSCFGNVFGYECSCTCGVPNEMDAKSGNNGTWKQSPSSVDPLKRGYY